MVSKYSICDVCHDIHYYCILDQNGYLVSFHPLHITKYGNVPWNQKDIEKMNSRILGKNIFKNLVFDPYVDAVSQATMSSYLVFDGLIEIKTVLKDFKENGFIWDAKLAGMDSDKDGYPNGIELGDQNGDGIPEVTVERSNPGDPMNYPNSINPETWGIIKKIFSE